MVECKINSIVNDYANNYICNNKLCRYNMWKGINNDAKNTIQEYYNYDSLKEIIILDYIDNNIDEIIIGIKNAIQKYEEKDWIEIGQFLNEFITFINELNAIKY